MALEVAEKVTVAIIVSALTLLWKRRRNLMRRAREFWEQMKHDESAGLPQSASTKAAVKDDRRFVDQAKIESALSAFAYYFFTFACLYYSISAPPFFEAIFRHPLLLSQARLIGGYLPPIPVSHDLLQVAFLVIALALYLPLLKLVDVFSSIALRRFKRFFEVKPRRLYAVRILLCFILCIPLATGSLWCFSNQSLVRSIEYVIGFLFIMFVLATGTDRQKQ